MIYTVTLNPSLDYMVALNQLEIGMVNRTRTESICCGGKGINVSIMLLHLEIPSTILGFTAGFTGDEIEHRLSSMGCSPDFIKTKNGISRINVKIKAGAETEINGRGPNISEKELAELFQKLGRLKNGDIIVLAGSLPPSLPSDIYEKILGKLEGRHIKSIIDTTGDSLRQALKYKPFLIKPNHHELGEIFEMLIKTKEDAIFYAKKVQQMGAQNVLVSMAGEGAVLLCENGAIFQCAAPKGSVVDSVGAGDSMVAGFLAGFLSHNDFDEAFKMGVSAGSATAFSEGLADKAAVMRLYNTTL